MPGPDSSAVSLESFVASALGEIEFDAGHSDSDDGAQSTSQDVAPGAPPVEQTAGADPTLPGSEGDEADQDDATPDPLASPDSVVQAVPLEEDPLAGIAPFTYTVNGQARTFDDIQVIPGKGGVISDAALSKLQQRFSERDTLFEKSQQQYKQYTDLERLTAWKTPGPNGTEQIITGAAAMQARDLAFEKANAVLNTIAQAFDNPELFRSLIAVDQQGNIIPDPRAIEFLTTKAQLSAANAERSVSQRYQGLLSHQPQLSQQAPDIQAAAPGLVQHFSQQMGVTLSAPDSAELAEILPSLTRPATEKDVASNPMLTLGETCVDPKFFVLIQRYAAQQASTAKTVQQASTVSKENAAKLAAANAGKTQVKAHLRTPPSSRPQPQIDQRAKDASDAWAIMEQAANGRFHAANPGT